MVGLDHPARRDHRRRPELQRQPRAAVRPDLRRPASRCPTPPSSSRARARSASAARASGSSTRSRRSPAAAAAVPSRVLSLALEQDQAELPADSKVAGPAAVDPRREVRRRRRAGRAPRPCRPAGRCRSRQADRRACSSTRRSTSSSRGRGARCRAPSSTWATLWRGAGRRSTTRSARPAGSSPRCSARSRSSTATRPGSPRSSVPPTARPPRSLRSPSSSRSSSIDGAATMAAVDARRARSSSSPSPCCRRPRGP